MEKRVLVVASFAPSLLNFRGPLLAAMVAKGYRVHAAAPALSADVHAGLQALGVQAHEVRLTRAGLNPLQDLRFAAEIAALCRRLRPDVFFGYTIKPVIFGSLAARAAGVPRIFSMITGLGYAFVGISLPQKLVRLIVRHLYRAALAANERVFFQNPDDRDLFLQLRLLRTPQQAVIINGSGVDLTHFTPTPLPNKVSFLLIARLLREKGIIEYAEAARRIRTRHPGVACRLAGWRDETPTTIRPETLADWQRDGGLEFLGHLADVRPAIAASAVYVLPSYREGTPRTVLEAMAMGRPIITTDVAGCRETVKPGHNGWLVPAQNTDALVAAMEWFIDHPSQLAPMGAASLETARTKYDVRLVNADILATLWPDASKPAPPRTTP